LERPLDALETLVPVYLELLHELADAGAREVQIDEPCLTLDRAAPELDAFADAWRALDAHTDLELCLATYFAGLDLGGALERVLELPAADGPPPGLGAHKRSRGPRARRSARSGPLRPRRPGVRAPGGPARARRTARAAHDDDRLLPADGRDPGCATRPARGADRRGRLRAVPRGPDRPRDRGPGEPRPRRARPRRAGAQRHGRVLRPAAGRVRLLGERVGAGLRQPLR